MVAAKGSSKNVLHAEVLMLRAAREPSSMNSTTCLAADDAEAAAELKLTSESPLVSVGSIELAGDGRGDPVPDAARGREEDEKVVRTTPPEVGWLSSATSQEPISFLPRILPSISLPDLLDKDCISPFRSEANSARNPLTSSMCCARSVSISRSFSSFRCPASSLAERSSNFRRLASRSYSTSSCLSRVLKLMACSSMKLMLLFPGRPSAPETRLLPTRPSVIPAKWLRPNGRPPYLGWWPGVGAPV
mmetsp:Transcript_11542/g.41140  ORF Transcript_11542/g.41140 Transcript_11542/m.41140 type:complete len:247 (+) Transcript_11542:2591-3331(+)